MFLHFEALCTSLCYFSWHEIIFENDDELQWELDDYNSSRFSFPFHFIISIIIIIIVINRESESKEATKKSEINIYHFVLFFIYFSGKLLLSKIAEKSGIFN